MILPLALALSLTGPYPYPADCPEGPVNGVFFNYLEDEVPGDAEWYLEIYRSPESWPYDPALQPKTFWRWSSYYRIFSQARAQKLAFLVGRCGFHGGGIWTEDPGSFVPAHQLWVDVRKRPWVGGVRPDSPSGLSDGAQR